MTKAVRPNPLVLRYLSPLVAYNRLAGADSLGVAAQTIHEVINFKDLERAKSEHYYPAKDPSV